MAYTNSSLVSYTKLSPNCTKPRNHAIDRITPHCVVGQLTAKQILNLNRFVEYDSANGASCNYAIGSNGDIGMGVAEENRSWCSSNRANDHRAITIECASNTTHPYAMNSAVYKALVELCVDICKRNGKKKLLWLGNKDKTLAYTPKADEMVLSAHRWFKNKDCPGDWLYSRFGNLADEVTAKLNPVVTSTTTTANVDSVIWKFFKGKGLNDFAIAGIMGNLYAESALNSKNLQSTYEKSLGHTDDSYTKAVDNGTYTNFVKDSAGYGLAQWTYWTRKQNLLNYAKSVGKSIGDLNMQLAFLWTEMQGYKKVMDVLKSAKSIKEASDIVLTEFERPADMSTTVKEKRASYGKKYYDKFASKEKVATEGADKRKDSFAGKYKVTAKGGLYIRDGAGKKKPELGILPLNTVVENWGYYTSVSGSIWLYVVATHNGIKYTGFCSKAYLRKL